MNFQVNDLQQIKNMLYIKLKYYMFRGEYMDKNYKIAIGTDAFPPTTDGISNVAQSYADI